jgi:hypothetical protein
MDAVLTAIAISPSSLDWRHRPCTSASARFCRPALSPPYECLERRVPHFTKMAASQYDITPIEMAHASLIGQPVHILSPLVASTYVLFSAAFRSCRS